MLNKVWQFIKTPSYQSYHNAPLWYKKKMFYHCLLWCLTIGLLLSMLSGILTQIFSLELGDHASDELLTKPIYLIIFLVSIAAPLIEELIFRAPLALFKKSVYFKYIFYAFTFAFGAVHITNFELNAQVLLLGPILIAPQIIVGCFLGYIRVRIGLLWSILLHAAYNSILSIPIIMAKILNIPIA